MLKAADFLGSDHIFHAYMFLKVQAEIYKFLVLRLISWNTCFRGPIMY